MPALEYEKKTRVVLATAQLEASLVGLLTSDPRFEVTIAPATNEQELARVAADAEILITRSYNRVTRKVMEGAAGLKAVAQAASGIDNIDLDAARELGIEVLSLPGINANAVAELVFGFLISLTRTVPLYTRQVRDGVWQREDCVSRHELAHYRLGLVGLGHVGTAMARLARVFGMPVTALDPYLNKPDFAERGAMRAAGLQELLEQSDIVSLHVPLTDETRRMIGAGEIAQIRRGGILINAARGEVIDLAAALKALESNHLGGLALDVFDSEPPSIRFPDDPRLILTPHIAGCTHECRTASGERLYEKIVAFCGGDAR
ncbi:MAG TPA: NAD(P)-dependent oxidoreductase [Thermoanaerobaculia bacterium]|nr:NAD(P)-dependent oxidoreductase [Thermoanaerobaculia bacterium]